MNFEELTVDEKLNWFDEQNRNELSFLSNLSERESLDIQTYCNS